MSKALTRSVARLLSITAIAGGAVALSAGAASATSGCTGPVPADPNVSVNVCYDYAIQDSDPTAPGAEVSTAQSVAVDAYGIVKVCIGRTIVGAQFYAYYPYVDSTSTHAEDRFCS